MQYNLLNTSDCDISRVHFLSIYAPMNWFILGWDQLPFMENKIKTGILKRLYCLAGIILGMGSVNERWHYIDL